MTSGNNVINAVSLQLWGELVPGLQNTMVSNAILSNQFETLVEIGPLGTVVPSASDFWEINSDHTIFKFHIDKKKFFSDGTKLKSHHFKDSWEYIASKDPSSYNNNMLSLFYYLEGNEDFKKTGILTGIDASDEDVLILKFKKPIRTVLEYLANGRFSSFLIKNKTFLGTGRYVINEKDKHKKVILSKNIYHVDSDGLDDIHLSFEDGVVSNGNNTDVVILKKSAISSCSSLKDFICIDGQYSSRSVVNINSYSGRFFSNKNFRLALEYLIHKILLESKELRGLIQNDYQVFMPFQKGRIDDRRVMELVNRGAEFVEDMIKHTSQHPIYFVYSGEDSFIFNELKKRGVVFSEKSGRTPFKDIINMAYKTNDFDLWSTTASLFSADPDSLYHILGKNGFMMIPMIYNKNIGELLESGKSLFDLESIDHHYQQISRLILEDVPFINLGFLKDKYIFNPKKIKLNEISPRGASYKFHLYEKISG